MNLYIYPDSFLSPKSVDYSAFLPGGGKVSEEGAALSKLHKDTI